MSMNRTLNGYIRQSVYSYEGYSIASHYKYEHDKARDLIQKQVYTLTLADQRHVVSEISNGVNPTQAYSAAY